VISLGEQPSSVHMTGCPSIDLAAEIAANPAMDFDPLSRYGGVGERVDLSNGFIVVMQHPVTTEYDEARRQVEETLHAAYSPNLPTLWFWPNVDAGSEGTSKGIRMFREQHRDARIHLFRNMLPEDFLRLLCASSCIVGNSSVAIRECSFLGVPAVNIGTRQAGRERGANVVDVEYDRDAIRAGIQRHVASGHVRPDTLYGDGQAGSRIADLLARVELTIDKRLTY
ncbi:MAG: UDP-N-acetylglucosamine 2-epimerase, partial [Acidobacteria bacterium]|nr:UDP-N-acetylglucosamine 2-epimerase [Acidobacteriota bacterium]